MSAGFVGSLLRLGQLQNVNRKAHAQHRRSMMDKEADDERWGLIRQLHQESLRSATPALQKRPVKDSAYWSHLRQLSEQSTKPAPIPGEG
jgi:hypothetical protein